jgi:hypothetical protein
MMQWSLWQGDIPVGVPTKQVSPQSEEQFNVKRQNRSWKMQFWHPRWLNLVSPHHRDHCKTSTQIHWQSYTPFSAFLNFTNKPHVTENMVWYCNYHNLRPRKYVYTLFCQPRYWIITKFLIVLANSHTIDAMKIYFWSCWIMGIYQVLTLKDEKKVSF